jgi:hypothetical protein
MDLVGHASRFWLNRFSSLVVAAELRTTYLRHLRSDDMEVEVLLLGGGSIGGEDGDLILPDKVRIGGVAESLADGGGPTDVARGEEGEEAGEAVGGEVKEGGSRRVGEGVFSSIDSQVRHRCCFFFFFFRNSVLLLLPSSSSSSSSSETLFFFFFFFFFLLQKLSSSSSSETLFFFFFFFFFFFSF